jgi:hypothetical protein
MKGKPDYATYGKKGGKSTSEAKVNAARENGKKGGRPRKVQPDGQELRHS